MPSHLFFMMEKQIGRIRAETDLRTLAVNASSFSKEQAEKVHEVLIAEQGEVYVISHEAIVTAEAGALAKLKALM